jgi:GNAT superfamily N-acetyltransferase
MKILISKLSRSEVLRFKSIRLRSLKEDPRSFGTKFEEAMLWTEEKWQSQLETIPCFLASEAGLDLGLIRLAPDEHEPRTAWLISMWVAPEARGRRVGSQLVEALLAWAQKNNFSTIKLHVGDFNEAALALYTRKGFKSRELKDSHHQMELTLEELA